MPAQMQRQMGVIPEGYQKDFFIKKTRQKFCRRTDQNCGGEQQKRLGPYTLRQQEQTQRAQPIDRADGKKQAALPVLLGFTTQPGIAYLDEKADKAIN